MNKDQILGKIEQIVGKAKQGVGEAAGSGALANEGVSDQVKGVVRETWGNAKESVQEIHDSHGEGASEAMDDETRGIVSRVVTDAGDNAAEDNAPEDNATDKIGDFDDFKERHTA